jgi:hypothetical protein
MQLVIQNQCKGDCVALTTKLEVFSHASHHVLSVRLRAVPPFRGFRFTGMRKERRDCRQHIKKWNPRCPTQRKIPIGRNRYACQSNLICSNYAINNFQSKCWFYTGCVKIKVIELQRAIVSELLRMNEIFSSSERSGF